MIPAEKAHLPVFAVTHPGKSGKNNEDNYAVSAHTISESDSTPSIIAIIADGVGGHQAGEVASSLAVEIISQVLAESDAIQPLAALEEAFSETNQSIYSQATSNPENAGMSTTAACAWVIGDHLYLAAMGDSRIYLRRGDRIIQLTVDHTWVQEAIESGILTLEQARSHPNAHLIRRYLGSKQPAIPDFRLRLRPEESDQQAVANQGMHLEPGDYLILCSDGLTDLVSDDEINAALGNRAFQNALDGLIELANKRGGHDNITIIGIQIPEEKAITSVPKTRKRYMIALVLVALFAATLMVGWIYRMYFWEGGLPTATFQPGSTIEVGLPTVKLTAVPTTQSPITPQQTSDASPSPISSVIPTSTNSVSATYTPWPTSTTGP
jgi:serine/threonine protein phosphatase PrpC